MGLKRKDSPEDDEEQLRKEADEEAARRAQALWELKKQRYMESRAEHDPMSETISSSDSIV